MLIILDRTLHAIGAIKDFKDTKTQGLDSHFDFIEIECLPHKDLLNENHLFFENQLYVIKEVVDTHDSKLSTKVYAEQRAVGYFLESIVRPQVFNGQSVAAIMATLLQHTDVKLGQVEDDGQLYDFEVGYQTSLKSIIDLAKLANLEIEYAAEMNGVNLARMTVNLVKERGRRIMKPFEYGINMGQVTRTKSSREQITSLIAIGKDGLTLNGVHLPGLLPEGFKVEGDYIYSEDALAEQGRHVFDVFNSSATTKAALLEESIEALKERSKVEAQYSCSIDFFKGQTGQRPHIGDTVTIKDFSFPTPLLIEARVQQIVSSRSNPQDNTVLIGNYKELTVNPWLELKTIREKIEQNIDDWNRLEKEQTIIKDQQQVIEQEQETIKDKQGSLEQEQEIIKDKQDEIVNEQEKQSQFLQEVNDKVIKQREDFAKEVTVIESNLEALSSQQEQTKEELTAKANTIQQQVDANKVQAEQVAGELNSKVQDLETSKTSIADFNQLKDNFDTNKATTDGKLSEVTTELNNVNNELSIKVNQTDYNMDKQGILTSIDEHTTQITQNSNELASKASQHTVDGLTGRVSNAESSITQNANAIKSKVDNTVYQKDKTGITTDIKNANTAIEQNATDIKTKASTSSVNALTGRVSNAESSITQNANSIKTKVDNTVYQQDKKGITTSIESANTKIEQNATDIKTKASTATVNTLTGRMNTAESTISQQAGLIASKVDSAAYTKDKAGIIKDVELANTAIEQNANEIKTKASTATVNKLAGRMNTAESSISQNANEIKTKVSSTQVNEMIDSIEVGGRNLLLETDFSSGKTKGWQGLYGDTKLVNNELEHTFTSVAHASRLEYVFNISEHLDILKVGSIYTFSYWAKTEIEVEPTGFIGLRFISQSIEEGASNNLDFKRNSVTFEVLDIDDVRRLRFYYRSAPIGSQVVIDRYKLEKGNKATDWTPAPEDTIQKITDIETSITQTKEQIELKANQVDIDNLTGRVSNAESSITLNTNQIKTKVDNTTYNKQTQDFKSDISAIDQKANSISSTVTSNRIATDGKITAMHSSITQQGNLITQKVSKSDYTGNTIASLINQTATTIKLIASKLELEGAITINSFNPSLRTDYNSVKSTANTAKNTADAQKTLTDGWKVAGTTEIDGANISTGTISFDKAKGGTLTLGGENDTYGRMMVLDSDGETIADLDASMGGFDNLYVGDFSSPTVPNYNEESYNLYVDPINGDDTNAGNTAWVNPKKTIQSAIDSIPKFNNGQVTIICHYSNARDMYGNILLNGFSGSGSITIEGQTLMNAVTGHVIVEGTSNRVYINNITINSTNGLGLEVYSSSFVYAKNMRIYGSSNGRCFYADRGGTLYLEDCEGYDSSIVVFARTMGRIGIRNCKGYGSSRGIAGQTGGEIRVNGTYPNGGTTATYFDGGGSMVGTGTPNSGSKGTVPPKKTSKQWSTKSGSNYGGSYAGGWESNIVRQGNWGYGQRKGLYYFGSNLNELNGKSIDTMRVWIKRQSNGGYSKKTPIFIRTHNYTAQPTGNPTLSSNHVRVDLAWGEGAWVTLPATMITAFRNGTAKGIGVWADSANKNYYSNMATDCLIEATYTE